MNRSMDNAGGAAAEGISLRPGALERPDAIAIGSSTGGPQALLKLLPQLRAIRQPIFITQHMRPAFIEIMVEHIGKEAGIPCHKGADGLAVEPGNIYVAPGDFHMTLEASGTQKTIRLNQNPPENFCRPAVDHMLRSLSDIYGNRLLIAILTGMGSDGRKGCEYALARGAGVVAQDEGSSVVWGMAGAVARAGLCHSVLPLDEMGPFIHGVAQRGRK